MDQRSNPEVHHQSGVSGVPGNRGAVSSVQDSFLGAPSSSFLHNVGPIASTSSSSFSYPTNVIEQGSSDSGNFIRASQPPTSVLGIPEKDRQLIKLRYGQKSTTNSRAASRVTSRTAANDGGLEGTQMMAQRRHGVAQQRNGLAQQRRVMAQLNPTGSRMKETKVPSFLVVQTRYSQSGNPMDRTNHPKRIIQKDSYSGDNIIPPRNAAVATRANAAVANAAAASGVGRNRRGTQSNQNNASAEDGRFASGPAEDESMETSDQFRAVSNDSTGQSLMQLHHQWVRQQNQQLQQQRQQPQQQQRRFKDKRSSPVFKRNHANDCNKNFNAEALCTCDGDGNKKLNADVRTDIVPERRRRNRANKAKNFDDEECEGEDWLNWHVDAKWGCDIYPEVYYCDEDCPSLLEYLLCPETERCDDDDDFDPETMRNADDDEQDLEAVITLRQGESGDCDVRNLNVVKNGQDDFTVSWIHPAGSHPTYVVVVYPPIDSAGSKARGPDCGACADEDGCICGSQPLFRMHIDGGQTSCDFPVECLEAGKTFIVEVATLNGARDESFGTSLVMIDVYELNK